jgi:FemAB-related protein (PEP-CTERM system-associated)
MDENMSPSIAELKEKDCPRWDAYVRNSPHGLPMNLSGWRHVLTKTYGFETHFLMAEEEGRVVGVLPMFIVHSFLVGDRAMTTQGGLCADNDEVALALIEQGRGIAQEARVKQLVLQDTRQVWPGKFHTSSNHVHWVIDVSEDPETLWAGLHREIRRQVRVARRNDVTVEIDRTGDLVCDFYDVLSQFTHQVGTPIFGQDFLEHVIETFPGEFSIAMAYKGKTPIAGYFQLVMANAVHGLWGATLREYQELRATHLAYWELIRDSAEGGYRFYDIGRSPADTRVSAFKSQWGGVSSPIYQQVAEVGSQHNGASVVGRIQSDGKFQLFMKAWPQLPLPVTRFLGPKLRRHVPFA